MDSSGHWHRSEADAYVHSVNRCIGSYRSWIAIWNEKFDSRYWYDAVDAEQALRGWVLAAKLKRPFHAPWATRKAR